MSINETFFSWTRHVVFGLITEYIYQGIIWRFQVTLIPFLGPTLRKVDLLELKQYKTLKYWLLVTIGRSNWFRNLKKVTVLINLFSIDPLYSYITSYFLCSPYTLMHLHHKKDQTMLKIKSSICLYSEIGVSIIYIYMRVPERKQSP